MEEKWKKFFFRIFVTGLSAVAAYFTSITMEEFVAKALMLAVFQALLPLFGEAPLEVTVQKKKEVSNWKKWLSRL